MPQSYAASRIDTFDSLAAAFRKVAEARLGASTAPPAEDDAPQLARGATSKEELPQVVCCTCFPG